MCSLNPSACAVDALPIRADKHRVSASSLRVACAWCLLWFALSGQAQSLFFDDFNSGASPLWGNEAGSWSASSGVYSAATPGNFPNAHSTLPYVLADFTVELDINNVQDGGIWLRSAAAGGTSIGRTGVLLVTGVSGGLYWHIVATGSSYGSILNPVTGLFTAGVSDPHLSVKVLGDNYSVFVNGAGSPATTLTTGTFASGQLALYDNSGQTFDNVSVVPEPSVTFLLGLGMAGFVQVLRRRQSSSADDRHATARNNCS